MTKNFVIPLPNCDENGTPLSKMPNCPNCGEDELGLTSPPDEGICYLCSAVVHRRYCGGSITAVPEICNCGWRGTVGACESMDDGELGCPQCLEIISVVVPEGNR
jgi:hypothetical protein